VRIEKEELVPRDRIPSTSADFFHDLRNLDPLLKDNEASYVILQRHHGAADGYVAVTYVPDTANVRQKMLFASTRLTLVRELGAERFRETLFANTKQELTAEGWKKHDKHEQLKAPLTEEERTLQGVKEAEAEASRGTTARSSHVSSGLSFPISSDALQALRGLPAGGDSLIQLVRSRSRLGRTR
jgi:twinfilin-like protein